MSILDRVDPAFLPILKQVPVMDLSDIASAHEAMCAPQADGSPGS